MSDQPNAVDVATVSSAAVETTPIAVVAEIDVAVQVPSIEEEGHEDPSNDDKADDDDDDAADDDDDDAANADADSPTGTPDDSAAVAVLTTEASNKEEEEMKFKPLPDVLNDEGAPITLGRYASYTNKYRTCNQVFCGRYFGTDVLPESDGRCGPNDGPSCASCKRFVKCPSSKVVVLKRLYPALTLMPNFDDYITSLLRNNYGHLGKVRKELDKLLDECGKNEKKSNSDSDSDSDDENNENNGDDDTEILPITAHFALSAIHAVPPKSNELKTIIQNICTVTNTNEQIAECLLQRNGHDRAVDIIIERRLGGMNPPSTDGDAANVNAVANADTENENETDGERTAATTANNNTNTNTNKREVSRILKEWEEEKIEKEETAKEENKEREKEIAKAFKAVSNISKHLEDRMKLVTSATFHPLVNMGVTATATATKTCSASATCCSTYSTNTPTQPSMIVRRGHRMILAQENNNDDGEGKKTIYCEFCASKVPSIRGGSYYCESCKLCEGCVQHKVKIHTDEDNKEEETKELKGDEEVFSIFQCPSVANGGHLHHHPFEHAYSKRERCVCDLCEFNNTDENRCDITWFCSICDVDVCDACMRKPAPMNYNRKENDLSDSGIDGDYKDELVQAFNRLFDEGYGDNKDDDDDDDDCYHYGFDEEKTEAVQENHQVIASDPNPNFNANEAEMIAALHWERGAEFNNEVVLGTGVIGNNVVVPPTPRSYEKLPITLGNNGNLPQEAKEALYLYGQPSKDVVLRSAADIAHAEDILRRIAPSVQPGKHESYDAILDCISAGKIGLAGTMLLSQTYAPKKMQSISNGDNSDDANEELVCWCGEVINSETSPTGAVGCLGGHAMHASCASDLLLGGGKCPTCRQTLFFSPVAGSEIKKAAEFVKEEIKRLRFEEEEKVRKELEELAQNGLPTTFDVGDIVLVPSDRKYCKDLQCKDPRSGYWHHDMSSACGQEGTVKDVVSHGDEVVSIRVISRGCHQFQIVRRVDDFECDKCGGSPIGQRRCKYCDTCEICCLRTTTNECSKMTHEWNWSPSLLTLLRRVNGSSSLVLMDDSEACKAEKHILRLRGELVAIKAAREAIKERTLRISSPPILKRPGHMKRELSTKSNDAVMAMVESGVAPADWQRARHLLLLARQWGNSDKSKAKRAELYGAVQEGNLDSVARIVRRYNAKRVEEAARWEAATTQASEYVVELNAVVELRAFPSMTSPRTGFSLKPLETFTSEKELFDKDGHVWIKVAPKIPEEIEEDNQEVSALPQGWIKVRPGGDGSAPIVKRLESCLRCFGCGDNLLPPVSIKDKYEIVEHDKVNEGDILLVRATLEKVQVVSCGKNFISCSFMVENQSIGSDDDVNLQYLTMYRACDLVKPKLGNKAGDDIDETVLVNGRLRSRRELVLSFGGDKQLARKAWDEGRSKEQDFDQEFASCARGHLLHARCLQKALVTGSRCPASGCMEQLFLPRVTWDRNDDDDDVCCGGGQNRGAETEALRAVSELAGHSALVETRDTDNDITVFGEEKLKMCPMCCSGPLFNQECSDMTTHHGQCSVKALGYRNRDSTPCTPDGRDFRVSPSEIAALMAQVSATKTVADLLPRCKTHGVAIMFNGCTVCGHLFTDTNWGDMPEWDPKARSYLEFDKKKRNAARLLTEQIRAEAALLQFERDAYCEAGGHVEDQSSGWTGERMDTVIEPPPMPITPLKRDNIDIDSDSSEESEEHW